MMEIYKITNTVNDMVYIGQTCISLTQRLNQHFRKSRYNYTSKFYNAMRGLGEEVFSIEKICSCTSQEELNSIERFYILQFDSINNGYNTRFGQNIVSKTDEQKQATSKKISLLKTGEGNAFYGKKHDEKSRKRLRLACIGKIRPFKIHPLDYHKVVTMRKSGLSLFEIAEHYNASCALICIILKKMGEDKSK